MALGQSIFVVSEAALGLLQWVWQEMNCQLDVYRTTKGEHIQLLRGKHKNLESFSFHL
jgi:hypothetical protein